MRSNDVSFYVTLNLWLKGIIYLFGLIIAIYIAYYMMQVKVRPERVEINDAKVIELQELKPLAVWWHKSNGNIKTVKLLSRVGDAKLLVERKIARPQSVPGFCRYSKLEYKVNFASLLSIMSLLQTKPATLYLAKIAITKADNNLLLNLTVGQCNVA